MLDWIPASIIRKHLLYALGWLESGVGVLFLFLCSTATGVTHPSVTL
jgi:hypothetical protein